MNRAFIIVSLLLALVVAALTVLVRGTSIPTAAAVARNTAIFSGFVFALAFAYPGIRGWAALPDQPNYPALLLAFVAAHLVHYGAVVARAIVEHGGRRLFSGAGLLTTAFGFSVVALIGLTARARPEQRGAGRVNTITVWLAWLLFLVAFASFSPRSLISAALLGINVVAGGVRIAGVVARRKKPAIRPANAS